MNSFFFSWCLYLFFQRPVTAPGGSVVRKTWVYQIAVSAITIQRTLYNGFIVFRLHVFEWVKLQGFRSANKYLYMFIFFGMIETFPPVSQKDLCVVCFCFMAYARTRARSHARTHARTTTLGCGLTSTLPSFLLSLTQITFQHESIHQQQASFGYYSVQYSRSSPCCWGVPSPPPRASAIRCMAWFITWPVGLGVCVALSAVSGLDESGELGIESPSEE